MAIYPIAVGHPDHSGSYIPNLYAMRLLIEFYKASVLAAITTTEYEEPVKKFGDKLTIRALPSILVKDYVKGQKLDIQTPEGGSVDLLIDKGKYWAFAVNALDKKQIDLDYVGKWATHAATNLKVAVDGDVLQNIFADPHASNRGTTAGLESGDINLGVTGTPVQISSSTIVAKIVDCGVVLDEQNVPSENRWLTLPSWAIGLLKTSDIKNANEMGDAKSPLRNGRVGMIDRFEIFQSNNLLKGTGSNTPHNCLFGHKSAVAFASQMLDTESLKNPDDFGDIVRSLQAYGYKTIKPEGLGNLVAYK